MLCFHRAREAPEPPEPAAAESSLNAELERLRKELTDFRNQSLAEKAALQGEAEAKIKTAYDDLAAALELAGETEEKLKAETQRFQKHIEVLQAKALGRNRVVHDDEERGVRLA